MTSPAPDGPQLSGPAPGWYEDPAGIYELRWWTGLGWSGHVRMGSAALYAPLPGNACDDLSEELGHLEYLEHFLDQARAARAISSAAYDILKGRMAASRTPLVARLLAAQEPARASRPPVAAQIAATTAAAALPTAAPGAATPASSAGQAPARPEPAPVQAEPIRPAAAAGPVPYGESEAPALPALREPSEARRQWQRARETVRSDLAVNGLAYLGVLLLFAGLFGVVAFSFSSLRVGFRPVAEVVVPMAIFGVGWLLGRRGMVAPAGALVLLGGMLVPVAAFAAFADQAPVPPDLTGVPLVLALTTECVVVATAYALWSRRNPASPLRHLIAPAIWLAVAAAALGFRRPIPFGQDIVIPRPGQYAAALVAITITLAAARRWPPRLRLAEMFPAALAGVGIAAVIEGLTAGVAGWPGAPIGIAGAATVLALDLSDRHLAGGPLAVLEALAVALTGFALAPALGVGWAGASATVAGVAVAERALRRAASGPALLAPIMVCMAGLVATVAAAGLSAPARDSFALLVAGTGLSAWAHARRLRPGGWPYPAWLLAVGAGVAPTAVLVGLLAALPVGVAAAVGGVIVLASAALVRLRTRRQDRFWSWRIPAAAVAVLAVSAGRGGTAWLVAAAAAATAAIALAPLGPALRVWLTAPAAVWTAWLAFDVAGVGFGSRMLWIGGVATIAVGYAALRKDAWAGQVGVLGHLAGLACWPLAVDHAGSAADASPTSVLGLAVAGLIVTTVAQEAGRGAVPDVLAWCGRKLGRGLASDRRGPIEDALRQVPAVASSLLAIVLAKDIGVLAGLRVPAPWRPVELTVLAVGYLLLAWPLRAWYRVARALADVGAAATILAAAFCAHRDPALVALAAVLVTPVLPRPALRRVAATWVAWAASVPFVVLAAELAGLPARYWYATTLGWGATLLLGGLGLKRVGRRGPAVPDGASWRLPPVVIGAAASAAGLIGSPSGSGYQAGWALIAGGAVLAAVGLLLRVGAFGGVGAAMAIAGFGAVAPGTLAGRPWLLLAAAAVLLVAADVVASRPAARAAPWRRWDLSLFLVAHGAIAAALGLSVAAGSAIAETTAGGGGLAVVIGVRLRRWPWAEAGAALILAGAGYAGPGWECLAFAAMSATATALAVGRDGWPRWVLQAGGALAAAAAWTAGLLWQDASLAVAVGASGVAAGAVVVIAAAACRISGAARDWALSWGGVAMAATVVAAIALANPAVPSGARLLVAAALAVTAIGCGLAAGPLQISSLRETAAVAVVAAAVVLANATSASLFAIVWGAITVGLVAALAVLTPWARRAAPEWVRPAILVAAPATVSALGAGTLALPDRALIVPALLLTAMLVVAMAAWLDSRGLAAATPVPLCAAWLAYASQALTGQPQWFTVPVGVTIIAVAGLVRVARRAAGRPVATPDVVALELTGMGLVMGASLVQSVTTGPLFGLVGIALAMLLTCWGALTRVRRRLLGGAIAIVASLLLLLAVPLARIVPHWGGAAAWLVLAGVGLVAIVVAALLDASRAAARRGAARFADLTSGWE